MVETIAKRDVIFKPGDIVTHYKRELLDRETLIKRPFKHVYRVIGKGLSTETGSNVIIYEPLDPEDKAEFGFFTRPYREFVFGMVDKEQYLNVQQEYKIEHIKTGAPL